MSSSFLEAREKAISAAIAKAEDMGLRNYVAQLQAELEQVKLSIKELSDEVLRARRRRLQLRRAKLKHRLKRAEERFMELLLYPVGELGATLGLTVSTCCEFWVVDRNDLMEREHGPKPTADAQICHRCDDSACNNPEHLFWGSPRDNMRDMVLKDRGRTPYMMLLKRAWDRVERLSEFLKMIPKSG